MLSDEVYDNTHLWQPRLRFQVVMTVLSTLTLSLPHVCVGIYIAIPYMLDKQPLYQHVRFYHYYDFAYLCVMCILTLASALQIYKVRQDFEVSYIIQYNYPHEEF